MATDGAHSRGPAAGGARPASPAGRVSQRLSSGMTAELRITEPDDARRVTSDGRFWSEVAAALEALAARCAERGYITDRLVLTGSGSDARDTWKVELLTTNRHRTEASVTREKAPVVPPPERYIVCEPSKLPHAVV